MQAEASVFWVRELLIRQRTQCINASCGTHAFGMARGHLGEYGQVVPQGKTNARRLVAVVEDEDAGLLAAAKTSLMAMTTMLAQRERQIAALAPILPAVLGKIPLRIGS